jgi:hypothetical protein
MCGRHHRSRAHVGKLKRAFIPGEKALLQIDGRDLQSAGDERQVEAGEVEAGRVAPCDCPKCGLFRQDGPRPLPLSIPSLLPSHLRSFLE